MVRSTKRREVPCLVAWSWRRSIKPTNPPWFLYPLSTRQHPTDAHKHPLSSYTVRARDMADSNTSHIVATTATGVEAPQRIDAPLRLRIRLPPRLQRLPSLSEVMSLHVRESSGSFDANPVAVGVPLVSHPQAPGHYYYPFTMTHVPASSSTESPATPQGLQPVDWHRVRERERTAEPKETMEEAWVPNITSDYSWNSSEDVYNEGNKYYGTDVDEAELGLDVGLDRGATEPPASPAVTQYDASNEDIDDLNLEFGNNNAYNLTPTPPYQQAVLPPVQEREQVRTIVVPAAPPAPPAPALPPDPPQQRVGSRAGRNIIPVVVPEGRIRFPRGVRIEATAYAKHTYARTIAKTLAEAVVACTRESRATPCSHGDADCRGGMLHCPGNPDEPCERKYLNRHKLIQHLQDTRSWCPDCNTQLSRNDKKSVETHRQSSGCISAQYRATLEAPVVESN